MAKTVLFTRSVSTPICRAASRSCAVARTAQPSLVKRRKPNSTAALTMPMAAISRSSAPMVPPPTAMRQSGRRLGSARGSGEKTSCSSWSSTKLMPMVASSGAMRAVPWQRAQADALDRDAEQRAGDDDDQHRDRQRRVQVGDAGPADIGADGVDRAVGEVDEVGDAEDQREADRQQRVDVADDQAVDGVVDPGCQAAGASPAARRFRSRLLAVPDDELAVRRPAGRL